MAWLSSEFYNYPADGPCRAVHMVLKALSIEYEDKLVDIMKAENKRPWFVRINPLQTLPVYNDQSFVMTESRAIMMYLCNKYATPETEYLYPKDADARGTVDRYLFFGIGTLGYAVDEYFKPKLQGMEPDNEKENLLKQALDYLDGFLEKSEFPFLCGEKVTIADLSILGTITELDVFEYNYKCYGEVLRYVDRLKSQFPHYKECCESGIALAKSNFKQLESEYKKELEKERKASQGKK